jgi:hypothetical protein
VNGRSAKRFEAATREPQRVQLEKLRALMAKNADTEYGKRYGFRSISNFEDYARQVPVVTYEDIKADMERVTEGASNVFTAEDPVMFAQTSGTTGDPKFVPVTPTCQGREHSDQMRTWLWHAQNAHPDIYDGKVVSLVSPATEGYAPCGLPYGSTSGHIYRNLPAIVRRVYAIPYDVFEIKDYTAKYYAIMRIALEHDVRFLATANPSSILKLAEKASEFADELIKDIRDGTMSRRFDIAAEIRDALAPGLHPNVSRARELEVMIDRRGGRLCPGDYWPRLSLIGCWKGGTVGHYLEEFPGWFDPDQTRPVATRDWGYLSSEARGSIPLSDEGSQGVLTISTNVFEFVEADELEAKRDESASWTFKTVGELEQGKAYYIFVTTTGGLYRYDINDVIEVTGQYNQTPQIVFLRKGRGMTNITGEKVSVNQVISVVQSASQKTGALASHFKAEADTDKGRYIFRVEFANTVDDDTCRSFIAQVDDELKALNIEYKTKRDSLRLNEPVLHVMRDGWYERQRREQVASGKRAFQAKTELLSGVKADTEMIKPEVERIFEVAVEQ